MEAAPFQERQNNILTKINNFISLSFIENVTSGQWYQVWYDDPTSLKLRSEYAVRMNLRGVGMWTANDLDYSNTTQVQIEFPVADLHNKILDAPGQIFFILMHFSISGNFGRLIGWRPSIPLGNSGSTPAFYLKNSLEIDFSNWHLRSILIWACNCSIK